MKAPPSLQCNVNRFAESNECLLALLGCASFGARLEGILREAGPCERPATLPDDALYLVLGVVAVHLSIRRGLEALANGQRRDPVTRAAEPEPPLSLRELLR